jgi:hypothetical protein
MKYFIITDARGKRHLIVAADKEQATMVHANTKEILELKEDTFDQPGFIMAEK